MHHNPIGIEALAARTVRCGAVAVVSGDGDLHSFLRAYFAAGDKSRAVERLARSTSVMIPSRSWASAAAAAGAVLTHTRAHTQIEFYRRVVVAWKVLACTPIKLMITNHRRFRRCCGKVCRTSSG